MLGDSGKEELSQEDQPSASLAGGDEREVTELRKGVCHFSSMNTQQNQHLLTVRLNVLSGNGI